MSIKIHHGPPGSYKTAGAVTDDMIAALRAGRSLVTNVRGVSLDAIHDNFPDLPDDFQLIHVDSSTREGREKLGNWFRWAPHGALIFIDEAQAIFPKRWKEKDLEAFTIDTNEAKELNRPANWWDAWDMHRHYNWDVILTTPDITKIRDDIRDASELAYKHKNQAIYGKLFKGSYLEGVHSKDNNGTSASHFQVVKQKRISKDALTWKLYESTATGDITETIAGFNLFSNPRLVIGFALLACCVGYLGFNGVNILGSGNAMVQTPEANQVVSTPRYPAPVPDDTGSIGLVQAAAPVAPVDHPLAGSTINYSGTFSTGSITRHLFTIIKDGVTHGINADDLMNMGYKLTQVDYCFWQVQYDQVNLFARCRYS